MKLTLVLVTISLTITVLAEAYPQSSNSHRIKRGFRANSASRVAHGYGKRDFPSWKNYFRNDDGSEVLSVNDMADLVAENPSLAKALVRKFVDINKDGIVTTSELLDKKQVEK
ncbi:hypothetical protein SNE40_022954 [Patella caerulea]|uniref:Allatotropin n=1 Tax=Patella caerulea TaxID=87958 RepID=A0AAN8IVJ8_PATCE